MSTEYRVLVTGRDRQKVDFENTCGDQHDARNPPLFHVKRSETSSAYLVRCPRSLTKEERARLKP